MPITKTPISTKRLLLQYAKWLPYQLGFVQKGAYLLQIKKINPDDVFIVSFPKSGNTWVRYIIAYLLKGTSNEITNNDLETIVPDVYRSKDIIDQITGKRFIKCHNTYFENFPKTIYIVRDLRSVLISYYHYQIALGEFKGNFSEYLRSPEHSEAFGSWKNHIAAALEFKSKCPERMHIVSFEALKKNTPEEIEKLKIFCGIDLKTDIKSIEKRVSFEELKNSENNHGSWFKNISGHNFFREGAILQNDTYFSQEDSDYLLSDKEVIKLMKELKYI